MEESLNILSTKINKLDEITGIGGFVKGHIVELCGEESCGKTALALAIANNISKQHILFVDTEHTADTKFFSLLGIDLNKILLCQPDNIDVALGVIKKLVTSIRILMTLKRYIVRNSQKVGFVVNLKVLRNKFASPYFNFAPACHKFFLSFAGRDILFCVCAWLKKFYCRGKKVFYIDFCMRYFVKFFSPNFFVRMIGRNRE